MTQARRDLARSGVIIFIVVAVLFVSDSKSDPAAAQSGRTHTVQAGENLFRIALQYGYTVEYLASVNGITDPTQIFVGQVLAIPDSAEPIPVIPAAVDPAVAPADPANAGGDQGLFPVGGPVISAAPVYHTVQPGETLARIGQAYGVTWADIAAANGISNANQIYTGQQLIIPGVSAPVPPAVAPQVAGSRGGCPPVAPAPEVAEPAPVPATGQTTHVVQAGEHLSAIARTYGVSWPAIAAMNSISDPNQISRGSS
jgi:LysM repeat protein